MNNTTDAAALSAPLWKRWWLILIVGLLVAVASYVYYKHQPSRYSASTQINLASGIEDKDLLGEQSKSANSNKAALANAETIIISPPVAREARSLLREEAAKNGNASPEQTTSGGSGKGKGKVRAKGSSSGSDIVTITAEAHTARGAARLANAYAIAYIRRERTAYVNAINLAILNTRRQLRRIELGALSAPVGKTSSSATGATGTAAIRAASLSSKLNQLESEVSVATIQQISPASAKGAELLGPLPKRNAIFGFAIGVVLAALAVLMADRLDRRLHGLSDLEASLQGPVLAALPVVRTPIVRTAGWPAPAGPLVEPLRRVHRTMCLSRSPVQEGATPRVILCTSSDAGDGKSTLVAGLALVKRDAGERVAVVETDLRRPALARLLGVSGESGLADVLAGTRTVWDVMQTAPSAPYTSSSRPRAVAADGDSGADEGDGPTALQTRTTGSLSVLPAGAPTSNPPPVAGNAFTELIGSLSEDFDCVLIDAPSPLEVSDTIPLLSTVDGILPLARMWHTREVSARRLDELLALSSTAPVLGIVANGVSRRELARSGFSTGRRRHGWLHLPIGR